MVTSQPCCFFQDDSTAFSRLRLLCQPCSMTETSRQRAQFQLSFINTFFDPLSSIPFWEILKSYQCSVSAVAVIVTINFFIFLCNATNFSHIGKIFYQFNVSEMDPAVSSFISNPIKYKALSVLFLKAYFGQLLLIKEKTCLSHLKRYSPISKAIQKISWDFYFDLKFI